MTTTTTTEKRARFRSLHEAGCFVLPNPWDVGSARMLQHLGFEALATTSSGYAWTTGRPDYALSRDDVLEHLAMMSAAVDLPINADFEAGFAREPGVVAKNVALAIATGVAGLSIEDRDVEKEGSLYDTGLTVERIRAARAIIDASNTNVILVGRTEGLLMDPSAVKPAIDKLIAIADAGADCLFAPGFSKKEDIAAMVKAVSPKPLNVLALNPALSFAELRDLGVRRISVGGSLARVGWGAMMNAVDEIKKGSFAILASGASSGASNKQMNEIFSRFDPSKS